MSGNVSDAIPFFVTLHANRRSPSFLGIGVLPVILRDVGLAASVGNGPNQPTRSGGGEEYVLKKSQGTFLRRATCLSLIESVAQHNTPMVMDGYFPVALVRRYTPQKGNKSERQL
jgi:hypothetical protein